MASDARERPKVPLCRLLKMQVALLLRKNIAVQLLVPVVMGLLLFMITVDDKYNRSGYNGPTFEVRHSETHLVGGLPSCGRDSDCTDPVAIVYDRARGLNTSTVLVDAVVSDLIASSGHISSMPTYATKELFNEALLDAPGFALGAVHFPNDFSIEAPHYTIQANTTPACEFANYLCNEPWRDVWTPLQVAVERALIQEAARLSRDDPSVSVTLTPSIAAFPHPEKSELQRDIGRAYWATIFFFMAIMFNFAIQVSQLVAEKELKLKLLMRMMGTRDTSMWLSWFIVFGAFSLVSTFMCCITVNIFQFEYITKSDFGIYFFLFFLTYIANSALAATFSTFLRSTSSAVGLTGGFVFLMWICQGFVTDVFFTDLVPPFGRDLLALVPPFLFVKGFDAIKDAGEPGADGMRWHERYDNNYECESGECGGLGGCLCQKDAEPKYVIYPMHQVYCWLVLDFFIYLALAVYLDQVIPSTYGRSQKCYYFLLPSYWTGAAGPEADTSTDDVSVGPLDSDVAAEEERVRCGHGVDEDAIRIVNLKKVFASGQRRCGTRQEFVAVARINLGIKHDTLFCLLGHNGAGKTTTFNLLSGMFEPTRGDAYIFGKSVRSQLKAVQAMMGICPQHDVLWPELSGGEHLSLFAGLSLVAASSIPARVNSFLAAVDLSEWGKVPSRNYSGGMRRRLSVACSLIADPAVCFLDEPTTGMDPVNRRGVWDVIEKSKSNRVIVLTTHAMEEADTLGDTISIMSRGRLHCLGTSLALKNKYGSGYRVDVTCDERKQEEALAFVRRYIAHARPLGASGISANISLEAMPTLVAFYEGVQAEAAAAECKLQIAVSMCSLEEVFIKIAIAAGDPDVQAAGGGARAATHRMEVTCPDGLTPGATMRIQGPDGSCYDVAVPRDAQPGQPFQVDVPFAPATAPGAGTEMTTVVCPAGKKGGDVVLVDHGETSFEITVPPEIEEGQPFQVQFPGAQSPPDGSSNGLLPTDVLQADSVGDPDGLLTSTTTFRTTPFHVQTRAALSKYASYQKRQYCTNIQQCLLVLFLLLMLWLAQSLIGLIIGGTIIVCSETNTLSYNTSTFITNPNYDLVNKLVGNASALMLSAEDCDSDALKDRGDFSYWGSNSLCCNLRVCKVSDDAIDQLENMLTAYGCDKDLYTELVDTYEYVRDSQDYDTTCDVSKRPNITADLGGIPVTRTSVPCPEAWPIIESTCLNLPSDCYEPDDPEVSEAQSLLAKYECPPGTPQALQPYYTFPPFPRTAEVETCIRDRLCEVPACTDVPPQLKPPMEACSADGNRRMHDAELDYDVHEDAWPHYPQSRLVGKDGAHAAAERLVGHAGARLLRSASSELLLGKADVDSFARGLRSLQDSDSPPRNLVTDAADMDPISGRRYSGRALQMAGRGDTVQDAQVKCYQDAFEHCKVKTAMNLCPKLGPAMKDKRLPVGTTMAADEQETLGAIVHDVDDLNATACASGQCFEALLELEPAVAKGQLQHFVMDPTVDTALEALAMPTVACIDNPGARCDVSRDELDEKLYDIWYEADRDDITYVGPRETSVYLDGAYQGAYYVVEWMYDALIFEYTLLYNGTFWPETFASRFGFSYEREDEVPALLNRLHATLFKALRGDSAADLYSEIMMFPPLPADYKSFSLMSTIGPFCIPMLFSLTLPLIVVQLVAEKSQKMRQVMVMTGLKATPYWLIAWLWWTCVYWIGLIIFFIFAYALDFELVTHNDFSVSFFLYLLYGMALMPFSFFLSTLFSSTRSANIFSIIGVFICVVLGQVLSRSSLEAETYSSSAAQASMLIPVFALAQGVQLMTAAVGTATGSGAVRLTLSNISVDDPVPIALVYQMLLVDFLIYTALFIYCDCVVPAGPGVKLHPLFFLQPSFWRGRPKLAAEHCASGPLAGEPEDVVLERARVQSKQKGGVRMLGVSKTYRGAKQPAVVNMQFGIQESECFGLLGSNGAGKTTTIHILCGLHSPSTGTVICGDDGEFDIRSHVGKIQSSMGVCSQDNLLWADLNGPEHLCFFGRLRRISRVMLKKHVTYWLRRVSLDSDVTRRKCTRAYSGGMKRRLSVANAFIGNPRLVYLDEPSTGLDPESRRQLWYAVLAAKKNKSIVLTTHALDEAEILCDRVGIMVKGMMRTVGTPAELRIRFDQGYKFLMAVKHGHEQAAEAFAKEVMPQLVLKDAINGVRTYELPQEGSDVAKIFSQLEARKAELHIDHWGLTHTSLEEVFLRLVAEAATHLKQTAMMVPPQQPIHSASSAVLPTVQDV